MPIDTTLPTLPKKTLLQSEVTYATFDAVLESIESAAQQHQSEYVCLTNVHMLVEAWQNPQFNTVVNNAFIATPDGKPLSVAMRWLYVVSQQQIAGTDLTLALLQRAAQKQLSVFFWALQRLFCNKLRFI